MSADTPYVSFPPGTITDHPLRIPLLWDSEEALALAKPPGVAAFQDSRVGGGPRSILTEINQRLGAGTPQFSKLGIQTLYSINLLEREASGVVLYAKNPEGRATLKNAMGSSHFTFRYRFITLVNPAEDECFCDLPLAIHREKPLALVSNKTGKKTETRFRCIQRFAHGSLWETESVYDRFHQVRLHAAEVGLPVLGDTVYQSARRAIQARAEARGELPEYEGVWLHLSSIILREMDEAPIVLEADYPRKLEVYLKKVSR